MAEKPQVNIPEQEVEFENLGTTIEVIVNGTTTVANSSFQSTTSTASTIP
jgi:hypothetical protein